MLVVDWMTPNVVAVKPGTSLLKCRNLLKEKNIRRLPVVDDANRVVGIVSDRDVRGASPSKATTLEVHEMQYLLAELKAKDIMTPRPLTVKPDATVEEAALLMLDKKIGGLPVVSDEGTLVGIITDQDLFKLLVEITGVRQGGVQLNFVISDAPGSMRVLFDTLRERRARILSVLTAYQDGKRNVSIRIRKMDDPQSEEELARHFQDMGLLSSWSRTPGQE